MARRKLAQEVFYKSFRYTSENDFYLHEFLCSLDNTNRFILSIIKSSRRYKNYITSVEDGSSAVIAGGIDYGIA